MAVTAKQAKVVELLIKKELPMVCHQKGETALHMAAEEGSVDIVRMLITKHFRVARARCIDLNQNPLHWAVGAGREDVIEVLLNHDLNLIDAVDEQQRNVFHLAAQHNRVQVMKTLLKYCSCSRLNALTTALTIAGDTPLHLGAQHLEVVKFLLEISPGLIFATDHYNNTVLHKAAQYASHLNPDLLELLLRLHPEAVSTLNYKHQCPLDLAINEFHCIPERNRRLRVPSIATTKTLVRKMCFDEVSDWGFGVSATIRTYLEEAVYDPLFNSRVLPKALVVMVCDYIENQGSLMVFRHRS